MTYSQVLFGTDYSSIILSDKIRVSSNDKLILSATNEISIGQTKISETNDNGVAVTRTNETRHIGIHATELLSMIVLNMGTGIEMAEGVVINSKGSTSFELKEASKYLQSQNVPREYRKQIIESFNIETMSLEVADEATYGLRFYDNVNAGDKGRYLFESFTNQTNRNNLASPYKWNEMTGIKQWQVNSGTIYIKGTAAPQLQMGSQYVGGANQWYINDLNNLTQP